MRRRCHDHKYDPITQKDYFQLYAFFNNFAGNPETVREPERGLQPPYINLTTPKQDLKLAEFEARMHDAKIRRDAVIRQEDLSDKWPDSFEKVSVPFIGTDSKAKPSETVFKSQFTLDSNPDAALVRFLAQSEVELFANGNFVGKVFPNEQEPQPKSANTSELARTQSPRSSPAPRTAWPPIGLHHWRHRKNAFNRSRLVD